MEDCDAMSQSAEPDVVVTDSPAPGVRRITLNRPEKLNAMNLALVVGLDASGRRRRTTVAVWSS